MIPTEPDERKHANARRPQSAEMTSRNEPAVWGGAILSRAIPLEVEDIIRRWRRRIIGTAILLPLLIPAMAFVSSLVAGRAGPGSLFEFAPLWAVLVLLNWPYVVFAARIRRHVLQHWLSARALTVSLWGGLLGLTAIYLLGYGAVMLAAAGGHGAHIMTALTAIALLCPLLGAAVASAGLRCGIKFR